MKISGRREYGYWGSGKQIVEYAYAFDESVGILSLGRQSSAIHEVWIHHIQLHTVSHIAQIGQHQLDLVVHYTARNLRNAGTAVTDYLAAACKLEVVVTNQRA